MTDQESERQERWAHAIIDALAAQGIELCCISPGSRSTPLTAAAARHPDIETKIFWDERNAAFFALGYARATGRLAPLICTSGTAAANYYPAIIEASTDGVPMLVLSADRPPELLDTGANQTIQQDHLFGQYVRWFAQLPCPTDEIEPRYLTSTLAFATAKATQSDAGPVHLNLPFRKPLDPSIAPIQHPASSHAIMPMEAPRRPSEAQVEQLGSALAHAKRPLLVIGRLPQHKSYPALASLIRKWGWPTCIDPGAIHIEATNRIAHFDLLLRHKRFAAEATPDAIVHIGGPLLSKHLQQLLTASGATPYIHIGQLHKRIDQAHMTTHRLIADIEETCRAISHHTQKTAMSAEWLSRWQRADSTLKAHIASQNELSLVEPAIARMLGMALPAEYPLFVGNSMPVRYMAAWAPQRRGPTGMNRGASGIDGLLSTAMGFFEGLQKPGLLYLGDLSLVHNLNALIWMKERAVPLTILVPNNSGGGIFGILPIAERTDVFTSHFHTPHQTSLAAMAKAIGINTHEPNDMAALQRDLELALASTEPTLIEIQTSSTEDRAWQTQWLSELQELTI